MGIFSKGNGGGLMNVIRCDEKEYLVWKWRPKGQDLNSTTRENSIRWGSTLHVKSGEVAVFVYRQKDGTQQDVIVGPYDETIKTKNFPVLANIVGMAFGGDSPFQAEVYFINLQKNNQVKFGVPYFDVADPRLPDLPVPVAVHGTITFALEDYASFISKNRLVDFSLEAFQDQIRDTVARKVKGSVSMAPTQKGISVMLMDSMTDVLSEAIEENLQDRLDEYGVTMKHIDIHKLIIDKESDNYIQLKASTADITTKTLQAQGDLNIQNMQEMQRINLANLEETMRIQREEAQRRQRLETETGFLGAHALDQQASVLHAAADSLGSMGNIGGGEGGGGGMNPAGMMTGMMMGGAMGGQMANMMGMMGQQVQSTMQGAMQQGQTPPPPPGAQATQYHVSVNGQQAGPFTMPQLQQMAQQGQFTQQMYVWAQGMAQWELAGNVPALAAVFAPATPPPPPGAPTPPPPPAP